MRMDLAGSEFHPNNDSEYTVQLPPTDHLVIMAGVLFGETGAKFSHPNVAAKQTLLHEFKHYHPKRGKWWTAKAGVDFYFVVPKANIVLLDKKGYSYVPVRIGAQEFSLSVSGGTLNGWTDTVREYVHIGCGCTQKLLKTIASNSLPPNQFDLKLEQKLEDFYTPEYFQQRAIQQSLKLQSGQKIVLNSRYFVGQSKNRGPFVIESKKGQRIIASGIRFSRKHIDWIETAKANGVSIPQHEFVNYTKVAA
jgi:hypothetical protein